MKVSTVPDHGRKERMPDAASESRLLELRREAEQHGQVAGKGIRPAGAPFPVASPEAGYYKLPLLKEPQWKWEVPVYFFVGGAAGAAALIGAMAHMRGGERRMVRQARWIAAGGGMLSAALLTLDLGRPSRFYNMLRVFKRQSPMSVGAWTLSVFSSASAAAAFADLIHEKFGRALPVRVIGSLAEFLSAGLGLAMASYTGVLIGATVIPVWNKNRKSLPMHFAASGLSSAVSLLELMGNEEEPALNWLGLLACATEAVEGVLIEMESGEVNRPLHRGASGWITRAGGVLSGPLPLALRMFGRKSATLRRAAALSSLVGSLVTRFAWIEAGHASARDYRLPLGLADDSHSTPDLPQSTSALQKAS